MLSQEARELLIKTQETIHDAAATAKIFGVSKSTVYARIRDYKARGTTKPRTNHQDQKCDTYAYSSRKFYQPAKFFFHLVYTFLTDVKAAYHSRCAAETGRK